MAKAAEHAFDLPNRVKPIQDKLQRKPLREAFDKIR
jgi:hypothetical protein